MTGSSGPLTVLFVLFVLALYVLAMVCLALPRSVQRWARGRAAAGVTARWEFLKNFIESSHYVFSIRAVGVIALLMAAFLTFAALTAR